MKARDVLPGQTVMCCRTPSAHHQPQPVVVTRVLRPRGTRFMAFAYDGAPVDGRGPMVTSPYLPSDEVAVP